MRVFGKTNQIDIFKNAFFFSQSILHFRLFLWVQTRDKSLDTSDRKLVWDYIWVDTPDSLRSGIDAFGFLHDDNELFY